MRAAVLEEYGEPLDLTEVPAPEPPPDGAVVSVDACGICRSDWHAVALPGVPEIGRASCRERV